MTSPVPPTDPRVEVAEFKDALKAQLDEMWLHDNTGDPSDEGYMKAVREIADWLFRGDA